jgi:hypothetical protein
VAPWMTTIFAHSSAPALDGFFSGRRICVGVLSGDPFISVRFVLRLVMRRVKTLVGEIF